VRTKFSSIQGSSSPILHVRQHRITFRPFHVYSPERSLAILRLAALSARRARGRRTLELTLGLCLVHLLAHLLLTHLLVHLLLVHLLAHGVLLLVGTASSAESTVLLCGLLRLCAGLAETRVAHVGEGWLVEVDKSRMVGIFERMGQLNVFLKLAGVMIMRSHAPSEMIAHSRVKVKDAQMVVKSQ
jgi:hypothetical protein